MDNLRRDIAEIEEYADDEDRLTGGKGGKKFPSSNKSNRIHMESQQNNKEKQQEEAIAKNQEKD